MTYKIDVVETLTRLYQQHGDSLFPLIDETFELMNGDAQERFFVDVLSMDIDLAYEPATEGESLLPKPVWSYFAGHDFFADQTYLKHRESWKGSSEEEEYMLDFSHDLGELLLVLDGQVSLEG